MIASRTREILSLAVFLLGSPAWGQYTFPPETRGDMEARLTVRAAPTPAEPGLGEVTLTLTIDGPESMEVEPPRLGDPTAAWLDQRQTSRRAAREGRAAWTQDIRLKQRKKGNEEVPDLSVRFRDGPQAEWQEAKWVDILKQAHNGLFPPRPPEETPSWLHRHTWTGAASIAALLLIFWMARRRRKRHTPPLPPDQWALRELDRLESTLTPSNGDSEMFHTELSRIVRRYLAERYVPHALQQTTAEFLDAVRQTPHLPAEQQARLRELFERCDLAKFARASAPPEECRRSTELARELVRTSALRNGEKMVV